MADITDMTKIINRINKAHSAYAKLQQAADIASYMQKNDDINSPDINVLNKSLMPPHIPLMKHMSELAEDENELLDNLIQLGQQTAEKMTDLVKQTESLKDVSEKQQSELTKANSQIAQLQKHLNDVERARRYDSIKSFIISVVSSVAASIIFHWIMPLITKS